MGLTWREILIACVYVVIVVLLVAGIFYVVLVRTQDKASVPGTPAPREKVKAGTPRDLPPIWQGKPEKPLYLPGARSDEIPKEHDAASVEIAPIAPLPLVPTEAPGNTSSPPSVPTYNRPDIHRVR